MSLAKTATAATIAALICSCSLSHTAADSTTARLDSLFEARYAEPATPSPGAAVIIARGDSIIYERYFGYADLDSLSPVDSLTRFNIASVSKQFTVAGLLQLAADGKVDIDAPLSNYFPEYTRPLWHKVTPRHLASQSSGIADTRPRDDRNAMIFANDSTSALYFAHIDTLLFEPGTAYDYINPTFILLARIIERATGLSFTDYQQQHIFNPAGMSHTFYFDPAQTPGHTAHGYAPADSSRWDEYDYGEETFFATRPDGGIYATARDMLAWEKALADSIIMPQTWLAEAYRPATDVASSPYCDYQRRPDTWYGLGWFIESRPSAPLKVFHTGDNGGFQAYVAKYPADSVRVIVLENRHDRPRRQMSLDIEKILIEEQLLKP